MSENEEDSDNNTQHFCQYYKYIPKTNSEYKYSKYHLKKIIVIIITIIINIILVLEKKLKKTIIKSGLQKKEKNQNLQKTQI